MMDENKFLLQNSLISEQLTIIYDQIYFKITLKINEIMLKQLEINFDSIDFCISGAMTLNKITKDIILSYKKIIEKSHEKKKYFVAIIDKLEHIKIILNIFIEVDLFKNLYKILL